MKRIALLRRWKWRPRRTHAQIMEQIELIEDAFASDDPAHQQAGPYELGALNALNWVMRYYDAPPMTDHR